jgi:hypothetical protein
MTTENEPSVSKSVSRNALTEQDYEQLDRAIANRMGIGLAWLPTFELAQEVAEGGGRLIPRMWPGGHTRIVFADGQEISLHAYMVVYRLLALEQARCAECTNPLAVTPDADGRERGTRLDRCYCSNACRQRAYRRRKRHEQQGEGSH